MPATWPASLPQLVNEDSFAQKIGSTVLRSDMDTGPAKVRRRFTKSVDVMQVSMTVNTEQYETLYEFFDVDLNGGANTFTFNHPITQVASTFRMLGEPSFAPIGGGYFTASMEWEKLP